ncbi:hypothetical protein Tco_0952378 [Tanacetum coccineum]|uniref:Uncharacterized protein n=1 Tax=Tanacetum coccineum TaxID=301880 RepID=A0ABQ5DZQ7_9ASTR
MEILPVSSSNSTALMKLEKKVKAMSKIDDTEATDKSVQSSTQKVQDTEMDAKEFIEDDVVDGQELTQDDDEPNVNDALEQNWFNEMVNVEKDPKEFDDLMGSTIDITKFSKNCLKKDKLTKGDLEGPAFALLKGNFRNNIELEYNLEQCYLAPTEHMMDFFFNKDLEYLKTGIKEKNRRTDFPPHSDVQSSSGNALCLFDQRIVIKKRVEAYNMGERISQCHKSQ